MTATASKDTVTTSSLPLQLTSYSEKIADDFKIMKQTIDYYINQASLNKQMGHGNDELQITMQQLYDAYNNRIDSKIFDYITNPYSSDSDKYKNFPAKIRSYNILRPSFDLLIGEWNRRGFRFDVINADGEDVFNSFLASKEEVFKQNVTQRFVNTYNEFTDGGSNLPSEEIPNPKTVIVDLNNNYKDEKALRGYRALKVIDLENRLQEQWRKLFKDWLLGGGVRTYKFAKYGEIESGRLSPVRVDSDSSSFHTNIEDRDWAVAELNLSPSTLVDMHYKELTKQDIEDIQVPAALQSQYKNFQGLVGQTKESNKGTVNCHYVPFKTKKKVGFLSYPDPFTGEIVMDLVDEDYQVDRERGEDIEWWWVNEVWHGWRVGKDKYFGIGPVAAQRNEMNNFSSCKLPINGRDASDTESDNVSLAYLGMPYQIMFIILMFRIELTIARNKGKIALVNRDSIPEEEEEEGGEEQFLWYAEAMGWAFVEPKGGFNQYQVLDMSLYQDIKELIGIANWVKEQWEELIGITRIRKGETNSSDAVGTTQASLFRGSIVSDLIFTGFEEFLESELQGYLDLSKYAWVDGKKGNYRSDDGRLEFLSIEPEDHLSSDYSVFAIKSSEYKEKLEILQSQINAIAQRKDVKTSTIIDLIWTTSITDLKAQVKRAEELELENAKKAAASQEDAKQQAIQIQKEYELFQHFLDVDLMHQTKDRDEVIQYIKNGTVAEGSTDIESIHKQANEMRRLLEEERKNRGGEQIERDKLKVKLFEIGAKERMNKRDNATALKNKVAGEK